MKNQLGPWGRSAIKAGEGQAPMVYDGLTRVPYLTASSSSTVAIAAALDKPISHGSITFYIEKNGVVTDSATLVAGQKGKSIDVTHRSFGDETSFRVLMSTSPDLTPIDLNARAWIVTPA